MERQPLLKADQSKDYGMTNPGCVPVEGAEGGFLQPPKLAQPTPESLKQQHSIPSLSEDVAREAFIKFFPSKYCYSSSPAKDGVITNMEAFNTYRYKLETFTESRSMGWSTEPYRGQKLDAQNWPLPGLWDIPAKSPTFFKPANREIKVPHTSSMRTCDTCSGMGRKSCTSCGGAGNCVCGSCHGAGRRYVDNSCSTCYGTGRTSCLSCGGVGSVPSDGVSFRSCYGCNGFPRKICHACGGSGRRKVDDRCISCDGNGRKKCINCGGTGKQQCATCAGECQLLVYMKLTINWKNNTDKYLVEPPTGLQLEKLSKGFGQQLFRHSKHMVFPVRNFPDPKVVEASQRLINQHKNKYTKTTRIIQQCHTLELIPVTRVTYTWKGNSYVYFVCGNELKVHTDEYPGTCCCSLM